MTNTDSTTTRARTSTPIERVFHALERLGAEPRRIGRTQFTANCPVCGTDSLAFGAGRDGRVLLHCWAKDGDQGCAAPDILAALGLRWRDLFREGGA